MFFLVLFHQVVKLNVLRFSRAGDLGKITTTSKVLAQKGTCVFLVSKRSWNGFLVAQNFETHRDDEIFFLKLNFSEEALE